MAIKKKSLVGSTSSKPKEAGATSSKKPGAEPQAKAAPAKKLAVAKLANAKLSTAKLALLRRLT
jgi:hypothetical protein